MLKLFAKYTSIGVLNTLLHWVVFGVCIYAAHTNQAIENFAGFVVAMSFSFFANAKFTFKASTYCSFDSISSTAFYDIKYNKTVFVIDFSKKCE